MRTENAIRSNSRTVTIRWFSVNVPDFDLPLTLEAVQMAVSSNRHN